MKYWTGRACIHGHISFRYVSSGACDTCIDRQRKKSAHKNEHNCMTKIDALLDARRERKEMESYQ